MVDCQVTTGGRGGPSFHENHGRYRTRGAKKVIAIDELGLPVGAMVHGFNQIKHLRGVRDDALAYGIQPLRGAIMRCDDR